MRDREQLEQANLARSESEEDDEPALLMAQILTLAQTSGDAPEAVYLNKEKAVPMDAADSVRYLDTDQ